MLITALQKQIIITDFAECKKPVLDIFKKTSAQQIVPVEAEFLQQEHKDCIRQPRLNISAKGFSVHVTEATSMALLAAIL